MEGFYALRNELRDKFYALVRSSESEEKFIDYVSLCLERSNRFEFKALEVILDLAFAIVNQRGELIYNCNADSRKRNDSGQPDNLHQHQQQQQELSDLVSYDADDEGTDETFIFPCHVTFDDCHPELLFDYHREHLKYARASTQILKYPKLCEFVIEFMFNNLRALVTSNMQTNSDSSTANKQRFSNAAAKQQAPVGEDEDEDDDDDILKEDKFSHTLNDYLNSMIVLLKRLNKVCLREKKNSRILARTNMIDILIKNALFFIRFIPDLQHLYLESILSFAFTLADYRISSDNLKQLFNLIKDESTELKVILSNFERLLNHHFKIMRNIKPSKSINFPTASRTAEEIEQDLYISNSWHWRLRSKVIEFKRKRSRSRSQINQLSLDKQKNTQSKTGEGDSSNAQSVPNEPTTECKHTMTGSHHQPITPSWLECSLIVPLSNISPLVQNGELKFCCSIWMSVCGDLLVIEENKITKRAPDDYEKFDSKSNKGYWLRLTSRKGLARRFRERAERGKPASMRRHSAKIRRRLARDMEDDEQDELDERARKSELELSSGQHNHVNRFMFNHPSSISHRTQITNTKYRNGQSSTKHVDSTSTKKNGDKQPQQPPKGFLGRRARENSQELLMHLVSFAIDTLTIEIWLNVKCMAFCARACRIAREGQTILLDQVTFPSHLEANGGWSHVVFCLEETNKIPGPHDKNSNSLKVMNLKVLVDGTHKDKEKLVYSTHKGPLTNFACLIGCERSTFGYVWKLSQINIYKNTTPKGIPMYLLGKGPDFWSFTNFRQQSTLPLPDISQRSIRNLLNPKLLDLYASVDEERALNWLTQNIVITYVAHQPEHFLDYSTSMTSSSLMNPLPVDHEFSNSSERFIQAKILNFARSLKFNTNHGFGSALVEAGGVESMMICFADVIRRPHETAETHSLAFSMLVKMSQTNQHHLSKFLDELNGLKLIEFILAHPDCIVSKPMLDCYLDFCLMRSGEFTLIKSPKLLFHLISCWRAWHKDLRVAKSLYRKLIRLLQPTDSLRRPKHKEHKLETYYINYNFNMMTDAGAIDILLGILRECLVPLDDGQQRICHDLVELIVNLISLLIKHPPGLDVMLDIMEFLLFLHPDPKAYVEVISDKASFLRPIQVDNGPSSFYRKGGGRLRGEPLSEISSISLRSSSDELNPSISLEEPSSGSVIDEVNSFSRATLNSVLNDEARDDTENDDSVENLAKFMSPYNLVIDQRLPAQAFNQMPHLSQQKDEPSESEVKCSNRNFAIASIADMLASIVKLTSTDPMKILSEALQKPIIDSRKLIILANNKASLVREKVLRLFLYCIRACYTLNLKSLLSKYEQEHKGANFKICLPMQLMARQLLKYPTTIKMIQLCYGIIVGIDDFETVETVCLIFDIDTINNNLQLNALILLIQLMTRLQKPKEIVSAVKFVQAYVKQLLQLGENGILSVLVKNNLIDSLMKIYFSYVEYKATGTSIGDSVERQNGKTESKKTSDDEFGEVRTELDKTLILIVRYFLENLSTSEAIKSIEELLTYFDLMNTYVPIKFQSILRDRKVKILATNLCYCRNYEQSARQKNFGGRMEYYLKSLFKNNSLNTLPNVLTESQLNLDIILSGTSNEYEYSQQQSTNGTSDKPQREISSEPRPDCVDNDGCDEYISSIETKRITETNAIDRFKATFEFALILVTTRELGIIPSPLERKFIIKCVKMLAYYLNECHLLLTNQVKETELRCQWYLMLPKLEKPMRANFSRLVLFLLSPCDSMNLDERRYYALTLLDLFSVEQLLYLLDDGSCKNTYRVLLVFIKDLIDYGNRYSLLESSECGSSDEIEDEDQMDDDETETKLKLLKKKIEHLVEVSSSNRFNSYLDKHSKKAKISANEASSKVNAKLCEIWMEELAQAREDAREKLGSLKDGSKSINSLASESSLNEDTSNKILEEALNITRDVVNDKHEQRKAYLEDLKQIKVYNYHIRQQWLSLIIGHTHERAIWFMKSHYPSSWELNPVEGPSRIRRRLRPCKLTLESRYLRRPKQVSVRPAKSLNSAGGGQTNMSSEDGSVISSLGEQNERDPFDDDWYTQYSPHPLCSMVLNHEQSMDFNELRIRMFTTDKIHFNCDCSIIRPNEVCEGEVSIASWCIHFIGERSDSYQRSLNERLMMDQAQAQQRTIISSKVTDDSGYDPRSQVKTYSAKQYIEERKRNNNGPGQKQLLLMRRNAFISTVVEDLWFDEIVEIWDRRYQLQDVGLEIFLTNNMTYLISFRSNSDREEFKQCLMREQHKMINLQRFNMNTSLNRLTQLWRDGRLTNFDYLTCLNKLAGRSFNDLMQYPIFPFVLSNYTSTFLDLNNVTNFRKLSKPMAIQNSEKETTFINNYQMSQSSSLSVLSALSGMTKPYHYGNHYSNSATVLHFLVRLPPFTQMLIQYQDNNFDQPDRTFHSIANTWQLITRDSNTDFKELIPEFYYLPEMFLNFEQFELGRKQNNELVDDVKLPAWCPNSDARLFTLIHRQALESAHVSENLHHWVDLIFGYKQTGKASIEAINVFHPATYYGVIDLSSQSSSSGQQASSTSQINSTIAATITSRSSTYSSNHLSNIDMNTSNALNLQPQTAATVSGGHNRQASDASSRANYKRHHQADIERLALETMIKTYGQMPRQLFQQPLRQRTYSAYAPPQIHVTATHEPGSPLKKFEPVRQVKGLRWGSFVGSPDEEDMTAVKHKRLIILDESSGQQPKGASTVYRRESLRRSGSSLAACGGRTANVDFNLCLLPNGEIAVLRNNTSLMLDYRADRKSGGGYQLSLASQCSRRAGLSNVARMNLFSNMIISRQQFSYIEPASGLSSSGFDSVNTTSASLVSLTSARAKFSPDSLSLVSWSYLDGIIRIRHPALNSQKASVPLVQADSIVDAMSACASVPELNLLLVGYKSGSICAHIVSTAHETAPILPYPAASYSGASAAAKSTQSAAPSAIHFLNTSSVTSGGGSSSSGSSSGVSSLLSASSAHLSSSGGVPLGPGKLVGSSNTGEPYNALSLAGKTLQSVRSIRKSSRWLYCHSKRINCIRINVSFGIMVTGSDDGTSVIWDLNSLTYVRTIRYKLERSTRRAATPGSRLDCCGAQATKDEAAHHNRSRQHHFSNVQQSSDYLCDCDDQDSLNWDESGGIKNGPSNENGQKHQPYSYGNRRLGDTRQGCICGSGVSLLAISDTLGDIASVKNINSRLALATDNEPEHDSNLDSENTGLGSADDSLIASSCTSLASESSSLVASILYVHTINGALVGFVNCHSQVTSVCYSNAPEGVSVNVIVVGLSDGLIRLYSSWDLTRVKEFHVSGLSAPITSMLYSRDSQLLYIAYEDGQLVVLRNKKKSSITLPKEWFL